jgi:hypothetical protein
MGEHGCILKAVFESQKGVSGLRNFSFAFVLGGSLVFALMLWIPTRHSPSASVLPGGRQASLEFEGPWALVPDPDNPGFIVALAPKTEHHKPLTVSATTLNSGSPVVLESGIYELVLDGSPATGEPRLDRSFLRIKIDPNNVRAALFNSPGQRYAIRLPAPADYVAAGRFLARVGDQEENYILSVALRYNVSRPLLVLTGKPDATSSLNPIVMETQAVRFEIEPIPMADDHCEIHARTAFRDLAKLLGMPALRVEYPGLPADCDKVSIPQ